MPDGYGWEDMRDDEQAELDYAEERERELEELEVTQRAERDAAFDLGFAEYEQRLLREDEEGLADSA